MVYAVLNRLKDNDHDQTLGHWVLYDDEKILMNVRSLELPDRDNRVRESRILPGVYCCEKRWSQKYGWHYHVTDVDGRTWILIHAGNYKKDTTGCILLGADFVDINRDGHLDVTSSRDTMAMLNTLAPRSFTLVINDIDKLVV